MTRNGSALVHRRLDKASLAIESPLAEIQPMPTMRSPAA
jgi:hypothetical protein